MLILICNVGEIHIFHFHTKPPMSLFDCIVQHYFWTDHRRQPPAPSSSHILLPALSDMVIVKMLLGTLLNGLEKIQCGLSYLILDTNEMWKQCLFTCTNNTQESHPFLLFLVVLFFAYYDGQLLVISSSPGKRVLLLAGYKTRTWCCFTNHINKYSKRVEDDTNICLLHDDDVQWVCLKENKERKNTTTTHNDKRITEGQCPEKTEAPQKMVPLHTQNDLAKYS